MPSPRQPRIRARLAGPSGLAAALALGAAGPASASVHRAAISGPGSGWGPAAVAATTDSPLSAAAVLGACGLAGFVILVLRRRKVLDETTPPTPPTPLDLEAMIQPARVGPGRGPDDPTWAGSERYPIGSTTGGDEAAAPVWVRRLNGQAPLDEGSTPVMDGSYRG